MIGKPKTLQEIIAANPDARAYWREVQAVSRAREGAQGEELTCETCGGNGFVRADLPYTNPAFGKLFPCPNPNCPVLEKLRQARYAKLCTLAQIPAGYQELTFTDWRNLYEYPEFLEGKQDAFGAALAFVAARDHGYQFTMDEAAAQVHLPMPEMTTSPRCSIAFYGDPGVGKTSLAVSIARDLLDARYGVVYIQLRGFLDALKDTFKADATEEETDALRRYQEAPVLVIDEFGIDATDWRKQRVYDLVNYRYANRLPTIFTTNYTSDRLIEAWGAQIGHRLQAMAHWIQISGLELRARNPMVKSR